MPLERYVATDRAKPDASGRVPWDGSKTGCSRPHRPIGATINEVAFELVYGSEWSKPWLVGRANLGLGLM